MTPTRPSATRASTTMGSTIRALPVPGAIGLAVRMAPVVRTALAARMAPVVLMAPVIVLASAAACAPVARRPLAARMAPVVRMPPVVLVGSSAGLPVVGLIPLVVLVGGADWTAVALGGAATAPQGGTCSVGRGPWPGAGW